MKTFSLTRREEQWLVLGRTRRSKAAIMTIKNGKSEGGPDNFHPHADQWLFVLKGRGNALINRKTVPLKKGTLVLIEAKEKHTITSGKNSTLVTLNFYGPPSLD